MDILEHFKKMIADNSAAVFSVNFAKKVITEFESMRAENARLQPVIDEANAQEPVGTSCDEVSDYGLHPVNFTNRVELGQKLYARPIPAQQSPAVAVPDYKEELFQLRQQAENWSTKLGFITSVINSRKISLSEKEREFPHLLIERLHTDSELLKQRSSQPAVAVQICDECDIAECKHVRDKTLQIIANQSPRITDPTELELHRADYRAIKSAGFESPGELLAAYNHLLSNRVTEQDAREIAKDVFEYVDARNNPRIEDWEELCLLGLLDKLNKAK